MKKLLSLFSLLMLTLTGCVNNGSSSSLSSGTSQSSDSSSSQTTSSQTTTSQATIDLASLLEALQDDDFAQKGYLHVSSSSEDGSIFGEYTYQATSYHDGDTFYLTLKDEDGELVYNPLEKYKNEDGNAVNRYLNYDNTFIDSVEMIDQTTPVNFDEYYGNPFAQLSLDNLEQISETEVEISGIDNFRDDIVYGLTGYEDIPINSFILTINGDKISGEIIGHERIEESINGVTIVMNATATYTFEIISQDEVDFVEVEILPTLPEHAPLQELFNSLKNNNYEVLVTRTGGSVSTMETIFNIYSHENYLLRTYTGETSGLYQNNDGLHNVELVDNVLVGTDYPVSDLNINMFRSNFELSPALFDVNSDGTFTLKEQFNGSYAMYGCVDFTYNFQGYLANLVPGTYKVTITEDGATIDYDFAYVDSYNNQISGHVKCQITNINALSTYEFEPYQEITYEKWSDFGSDISTLISKYLGENFDNILPFINYLDYSSSNSRNFFETTYAGKTYAQLSIIDTNNKADEILAEYTAKLEEIGWINSSGNIWVLEKEDGSGYYHIEVLQSSNRYFYIRLYQMGTNSLAEYLNKYFASTVNSTVELTHTKTYYNYDASTQTKGDVYQTTTEVETFYFTDTAVRQVQSDEREMYFVDDGAGNFIIYNQTSTGEYTILTSYPENYYDVKTYPNYGTLIPSNIVNYASYLTYVEGSDGQFVYIDNPQMPSIYVANTIVSIFFGDYSLSTSYDYLEVEIELNIDFVANQTTLKVSASRISGNYIIEDVYTARYYNLGNTKVDISHLPPLE